uniref:Uncharacterized protein n=1 Tax=Panagrellus redivivus TaxID=6233 RepID=A0A7E4VYJ3_PANRE
MGGGLEFEVLPEMSLRSDVIELVLGTPINQVITGLQNANKYIRNVELTYSKKEPWKKDITITLKSDGIRLLFDASTQVLKVIEVYDFKNITLKYSNVTFSSPGSEAHVSKIEKCFGATHPGVYDEKQKIFVLQWRGIYFCFPAPSSTVQQSYAHGFSSLHFDTSTLPSLSRMTIFSGTNPLEPKVPEVPLVAYCGNSLLADVSSVIENNRIAGLKFAFFAEDTIPTNNRRNLTPPRFERIVRLGDTEQTVLANLGAPARVFFNANGKMLIQRDQKERFGVDRPDKFLNYFTLGTVGFCIISTFNFETNIKSRNWISLFAPCRRSCARSPT